MSMLNGTFLNAPESNIVFRDLFEHLYRVQNSTIVLNRIMHWKNRFGVESPMLDSSETRILGGHFYQFSSSLPSLAEIQETISSEQRNGIRQFLLPVLRGPGSGALNDLGFLPIPWFVESIYEIREGVSADLKTLVSRNQFKDIHRLERKAESEYQLDFYEGSSALDRPDVIETVANLHELNLKKYAHELNFYSKEILMRILSSKIGKHLFLALRTDKETGKAVQASVNFIDRTRKQFFMMVQGVDRQRVRPGHNLYVAETIQLYRYVESQGIKEVHLGRGGHSTKKRLGANRFHILHNWVLNTSDPIMHEVEVLRKKSTELIGFHEELNN